MSQRYEILFSKLKEKKQIAFVPFVVLGDPSFDQSIKIIETLIKAGADALELGIAFSDPMADGPTIQNANLRAFEAEMTVDKAFDIIQHIRKNHPDIPIGLLLYTNLIHKRGINEFYNLCSIKGVDSVLIADVPMKESKVFMESAIKYNICPIFICPPEPSDKLIEQIAQNGKGYTYLLSRAGVTGVDDTLSFDNKQLIDKLKLAQVPPILQGFGISTDKQIKELTSYGIDGAISGSAVVSIIEKNLTNFDKMQTELYDFVKNMKNATYY